MLDVLYKYLVLTDHAGIPGIGSFNIKRSSAQFKGSSFYPPVTEVTFQPGTALTDKNFYHFVAEEKGISEVDAVRKFQDFAYQLRKDIQSHAVIHLGGIGVLKKNSVGELNFETEFPGNYFPTITPEAIVPGAAAVVSEEPETTGLEEETIVKKDRWWIWATVLALLALAAIGFFYMQENNF
jgi:hypothetical protein